MFENGTDHAALEASKVVKEVEVQTNDHDRPQYNARDLKSPHKKFVGQGDASAALPNHSVDWERGSQHHAAPSVDQSENGPADFDVYSQVSGMESLQFNMMHR